MREREPASLMSKISTQVYIWAFNQWLYHIDLNIWIGGQNVTIIVSTTRKQYHQFGHHCFKESTAGTCKIVVWHVFMYRRWLCSHRLPFQVNLKSAHLDQEIKARKKWSNLQLGRKYTIPCLSTFCQWPSLAIYSSSEGCPSQPRNKLCTSSGLTIFIYLRGSNFVMVVLCFTYFMSTSMAESLELDPARTDASPLSVSFPGSSERSQYLFLDQRRTLKI